MKIVLAHRSLQFISTGRAKIHVHDEYQSFAYTLCGILIPSGTEPQVSRKIAEEQLCKRCYASLNAYRIGCKVRIESEVQSGR